MYPQQCRIEFFDDGRKDQFDDQRAKKSRCGFVHGEGDLE
eukprot:CAMPEP_0171026964 /NCGR_PEP_ID=MMETSP0736-20130129/34666_1 /TAXON_ID=186038 /ORGANISM="Fragilariopsis kerguelensis, Strain L26-C5" /LENGTH=39 /DNA_ID= /DNA_START= /DNA_END= /DNA_ORIENTATION=